MGRPAVSFNKKTPSWTAEEDRRLRILWLAGWSTLSIGIDIGRGKNAVCGRARRIELPLRENPVPQNICPDKADRFRREIEAGYDAGRRAIARAA